MGVRVGGEDGQRGTESKQLGLTLTNTLRASRPRALVFRLRYGLRKFLAVGEETSRLRGMYDS